MLKKKISKLNMMIHEQIEEQQSLREEQKYLPSSTQLAYERKIIKLHEEEVVLKFCRNVISSLRLSLYLFSCLATTILLLWLINTIKIMFNVDILRILKNLISTDDTIIGLTGMVGISAFLSYYIPRVLYERPSKWLDSYIYKIWKSKFKKS